MSMGFVLNNTKMLQCKLRFFNSLLMQTKQLITNKSFAIRLYITEIKRLSDSTKQ